jgi:outer membrane receptor protein involved in Fe transport
VTDATNDHPGSTANSLISVQPGGFAANVPLWFGSPYDSRDVPANPYTTVANGRLTYRAPGRGWSAAFQVTNLTDKVHYISRTYTGLNDIDAQLAPPREWRPEAAQGVLQEAGHPPWDGTGLVA